MSKSIRSDRQLRLIELLIEARKKAKLTQAALAERVGRPQSFIAKYENGERRLDVVEFIALIEAMDGKPVKIFAKLLEGATSR